MAIEWTSDLAVGHEEIDRQHEELFERTNRLLDAMEHGRGRDETERTLDFLADYMVTHFKTEERQMAIHGFRGISGHMAEHAAFMKRMLELRDRYRAGGPTPEIGLEVQELICGLLVNHMLRADQALASFLKKPR